MSRRQKEKERLERVRQFKARVIPYDLLKLTAFHEAGHVAFATLHGNPVEIVTIDSQKVVELTGKNCPGYTRYAKQGLADADYVLGLTAVGLTSEAMLVTGGVINAEEEDLKLINEMIEGPMRLQGEEKDREMMRLRLRTQSFVASHSAAITKLAIALMEIKTLTGPEIDKLLKS
jgi:ATP-dependent Zn protease